ncbi:hypothetical protein X271_00579 [Candidatus Hepatoplasma crinochetorum Av]|uniref:Uncharacterized protein n=1 Tax=Candidatus Hepatoplasma crinochetorum Av TaxID=1427984 RepID=W8GTA7_9MOLU|nr:hypothetical protein [Candidatus Hepatoplasma crinochetorum]AHK22665.1 hypothetical protein X271_00579 [Candidatus Hepatoplasma crinochetorum Av]
MKKVSSRKNIEIKIFLKKYPEHIISFCEIANETANNELYDYTIKKLKQKKFKI